MVIDTVRGYVQLANGLGDVTKQRATQVARQIAEQGGVVVSGVASSAGSADVAKQIQGLAEDLFATARTNRDLLIGLIRTEVERTVNRLGLVGADELNAMARVVERLQNQLDAAIAFGGRPGGATRAEAGKAGGETSGRRTVKRAPVTFADAPASGATASAAKKATAKKTAAKKSATKKSATKKAAAKQSTAKKVPVKRVPPKPSSVHQGGTGPAPSAPSVPPPPPSSQASTAPDDVRPTDPGAHA
jgi:hypothetical protein